MLRLHYIYDPLCGWCYAAEGLVELAQRRLGDEVDIELHGGGLFQGGSLPEAKRHYIRGADLRIASLTGQTFGSPYLDGLLSDGNVDYDSKAVIAGILAVEQLAPDKSLAMLRAVQRAHYRDGMRVVEAPVLALIAQSVGLDRAQFLQALLQQSAGGAARHIAATRQWMHSLGATGYPTFFLQFRDRITRIDHESHYATPGRFVDSLVRQAELLTDTIFRQPLAAASGAES